MSYQEIKQNNLREVSQHAEENCKVCKWYLPHKNSGTGICARFDYAVNDSQLCDGFQTSTNMLPGDIADIREYQQRVGFSKQYIQHPQIHVPFPTPDEIESNFMNRYFIRYRSNIRNPIMEVNEETYKGVSPDFYIAVELRWKINGAKDDVYKDGLLLEKGIANANKDTIKLKNKDIPGLDKYLTDYTELAYSKKQPKEKLDKKKLKKKSVYGSGTRPIGINSATSEKTLRKMDENCQPGD